MRPIYMQDDDYRRFVNFIMDSFIGGILKDHRDLIMIELGEKAGIWPEYTRPDDEREFATFN